MEHIAADQPGDVNATEDFDGLVVTGAAQALLHPDWTANGILVGGPGQGKSTLLQYVCQFHRARLLNNEKYTGEFQKLTQITQVVRVPIRLDLRKYALWANGSQKSPKGKRQPEVQGSPWRSIEEYIAAEIGRSSGGRDFSLEDVASLVSSRPVLLALDGLDEVANLNHRERVSLEIVATQARLAVDAANLVVLVASRPGSTTSALWSSSEFPRLTLQRLTHGLRMQYLQRWARVAELSEEASEKLQRTFLEHQNAAHDQSPNRGMPTRPTASSIS